MTVDEQVVYRLRADARERSRKRPRLPFAGAITDDRTGRGRVRRYSPAGRRDAAPDILFFHGGYGVLGDLDLQDAYCRRIAALLAADTVSVDYALAPESTLVEAARDAVAALDEVRESSGRPVALWGDSAGGAVALAASTSAKADFLILTNPNVDLSLRSLDTTAPGGPDAVLSSWAFQHWATVDRLEDAPDLAAELRDPPPLFAAVGSLDSLLPDAQRLVDRCAALGVRSSLTIVPGASHGFMSGDDVAVIEDVIAEAGRFMGTQAGSV